MNEADAGAIEEIIEFWLGRALESPRHAGARKRWWYRGGPRVDNEIAVRFGDRVATAIDGGYVGWQGSGRGALALVLLLDQFTRNLFRHTPRAYAGDARAFAVLEHALAEGLDRVLHPVERIWLYHPLHHAESVTAQDRGLALLDALVASLQGGQPDAHHGRWLGHVERSIEGWRGHRDIVAQFGRFPHRNEVLGRTSTGAEREFLAAGAKAFGQGKASAS